MEKVILSIQSDLKRLEEKIDLILKNQNDNAHNINKMGNHIDFVENVYEKVKRPMYYICDKLGGRTNGIKKISNESHNK